MAKAARRGSLLPKDFSQWNFIIFLTLSFILLVIVALNLKNVSLDLRTRAAGCTPITSLPHPDACPGGEWRFKRDPAKPQCLAFFCEPPEEMIEQQ